MSGGWCGLPSSGATGGGLSVGPPGVHIHGRGQGYPSSHTCLSFPMDTMGKASICPAVAKPSVVWRMGLLPQWEPGAWSSLHQGDLSRGQGQWECHRLCPLHTSLRQAGGRQGKQPAFCQPVAPSSGRGRWGAVAWHLVGARSSLSAGHQGPPLAHPHPQGGQLRLTHIHFGFSFDKLEALKVVLWGGEETSLWLLRSDTLFPAQGRLDSREPFPGLCCHGQPVPQQPMWAWNAQVGPDLASPPHPEAPGSHGELAAATEAWDRSPQSSQRLPPATCGLLCGWIL